MIDVNRARTEPIPIAIPDLGGPDGASAQLGHDMAGVISADLARSGLFRLIAAGCLHPVQRLGRRRAELPELEADRAPRRW